MAASGDPFYEYVSKLAGSVVVHPLTFSRILVQLGWEPDPPSLGKNLFRRQKLFYPNMFRHVGRVRDEVGGVFPLWTTGLLAKLTSQVIRELTLRGVEAACGGGGASEKNWELNANSLKQMAQRCCYSSVGRSLAVFASYPLHSVMVRQMAAAVSHDAIYRGNILSVIREIFNEEGMPGFFRGVTVAIVGDLLALWATSFIAYAVNQYIIADRSAPDVKQVSPVIASFLVSSWTYRYGVVSTNLCIRGSSGLSLCVPYTDSVECWQTLKLAGGLSRGDSLFFRVAPQSAMAATRRR
ncbi:hypothetical protein BOX15_Mlig013139g1 [Macrostomum lignano]|uniref:Uncharacterized protein n=2 Tax=Macrostomum lignano TaxID=282301 RepID=A0A267FPC2_9PLAT|nr:hypothetical protein BOX15_Mlig004121g1 [Macrostomum lignano]PAA75064.1 hypothetical protein BOX15_Mlig013139g1 [Macrostomum lignano]